MRPRSPWTEQYPAIAPDWDVIARLPDSDVTGYQLSDSARFRIDEEYRILRWQNIREQGDYQLEVTDADGHVGSQLHAREQAVAVP